MKRAFKSWQISAVVLLTTLAARSYGQTAPSWVQVAGYTVNLGLAGPASGAIRAAWYARSAAGNRLLVQTESARVFETTDFLHWKLNSSDAVPQHPPTLRAHLRPEAGLMIAASAVRRYSVTRENVYSSEDGHTWVNLTGFNGQSILGGGFTSLAVSPGNALDIVAGNQFGLWRSLDGGLSWQSINEGLPNLEARSLVGQRVIALADTSPDGLKLALVTGGRWTALPGDSPDTLLRVRLATESGLASTAAAQSGTTIYLSGLGGLVVSSDDGASWTPSALPYAAPAERIWADPGNPLSALASAGGRLFRTTNGGRFWDDVTGSLNAGSIHGIAADSVAGVVYLAADRGVFSGRVSLNSADPTPASWASISGDLPFATAWDARLNTDGTLTVLLDGYGVFESPAPHRAAAPRIVNGADMSERAAAPGSLITVLGANVKQARSNGNLFPVLLPSAQSSQLQVPFELSPGIQQLIVEGADGVFSAPLNVKQAAPAIFVDADGAPMIQDSATGLVIDPGVPVRGGSRIQVLATGLGKVTPDWPTGTPAPVDAPPAVVAPVTAYLDGTPIRVSRATLAPTLVGNYLVELEIPRLVNRGVSELRIVVNSEESNRVRLYLDPGVSGQ